MFDNFIFSKFSFHLKVEDTLSLPSYKGSTLRGGFGHAFKRVVCTIRNKTCDDCLLKSKCIYFYIFETQPPEDSEALRKYRAIPHPFVIEPPLDGERTYKPGELLTFNLILVGKTIQYLPYFIYSFEELGRIGIGKGKGRFKLAEVRHLIPDCKDPIYNERDKILRPYKELTLANILKTEEKEIDSITINFITPARIVIKGDLVVDLEFHHFIKNLLRRISNLSYFHCGIRLGIDFKGLGDRTQKVEVESRDLKWFDWERYSARQDTRMKLGGVIGRIAFKGEIGEFMPFIKLGEFLHVGKGTTFGLGKYEIAEYKTGKIMAKTIEEFL